MCLLFFFSFYISLFGLFCLGGVFGGFWVFFCWFGLIGFFGFFFSGTCKEKISVDFPYSSLRNRKVVIAASFKDHKILC